MGHERDRWSPLFKETSGLAVVGCDGAPTMEREGSCHRFTVVDQCGKGHECGLFVWPLETHHFNQVIRYKRR